MTSETPNLHVSKNLNISRTKQDIEKLKTPLRLVLKCCSVVFKIGSKFFRCSGTFKGQELSPKQEKQLLARKLQIEKLRKIISRRNINTGRKLKVDEY